MDLSKIVGFANNVFSLVRKVTNLSGVEEKMDALKKDMGLVSARKDDFSFELEQEEQRPGKRRKKEVGLWIRRVRSTERQVRKLGRKVRERHFFSCLMLADQVSGLATKVEKLHENSRFFNGLTLDVKPARGYELQPGELVGQASQTLRDKIWDCLMKEEVLRVGVCGPSRVGKTFLAKHIHDQIMRDRARFDGARFDGACLVTVSQEGTVGTIQTDIAKYLELDLTGVSRAYWGARLKEALRGRRLLFILDDVGKYHSLDEVGIALDRNGCKLIVTSRSRVVCEQMKCLNPVYVPNSCRGGAGRVGRRSVKKN